MKFNEFGKTGMRVSEIGFGGSRIGGLFAGKDSSSKEALNVLVRRSMPESPSMTRLTCMLKAKASP